MAKGTPGMVGADLANIVNEAALLAAREKKRSIDMDDFRSTYQVNESFLEKTKFKGSIMHPGPINIDLEISQDVAISEKSLILTQVENGLYTRAALLQLIT